MDCLHSLQTGAIKASLRSGGLDDDHAFGDCSSRQPHGATPRNPCRMRGNLIYRSGPGYHRLLHGRPARVESSLLCGHLPVGLGDGLNGGHAPAGIALVAGKASGLLDARASSPARSLHR
jgi:hypothetical protein